MTISIQTTVPLLQVWSYAFRLRGQAKMHSKMHDLLHTHSGVNAHDLEFVITVPPSNPMSSEVVYLVEKKTTAKAYHVNYHKAEHVASKPNHIIYVSC